MARIIPIGIDLGTTNSAVAWVDESGRSAMVTNAEGDLLTPSIVFFGENETVVGKDARSATTAEPDKVAEWVKRDMGRPTYSRPLHGEYLPPEVIQACILRKLKNDVIGQLGPDCRAVITVPAYFDELRRKATADAGEMAGLGVLDIVNEPTAAALAFAETQGYLSSAGGLREEMTVLVYDLGGGTFDVTLLNLTPGNINTLATDGDVQLGGHDWDDRLVNHVAEQFKAASGIDPRDDPAGVNRVFNAVVEAKHTLSARSKTTVRIDHQGQSHEIPLTRETFKDLTADLLERTAYTCRQLINTAGLSWDKVSRVLLVGGSTRLPMVSEMLKQMTGIAPDRTVNPDEAVARGAAIYASYLLTQQDAGGPPPSFQVTNVNAHSLGVEGIDPATMRKKNFVLIARNTSLPAKFTYRFATKSDGQKSIVVQVLEGESSLPSECTMIGRTVIRDLPQGLTKGWPIDVTFEYGTNGRLAVRAVVPGTHHDVRLELERESGLTGDGIARWKPLVAASAGFDAYQAMAQGAEPDQLPVGQADAAAPAPAGPEASQPAAAAQTTTAAQPGTPAPASSPWEGSVSQGSPSQQPATGATPDAAGGSAVGTVAPETTTTMAEQVDLAAQPAGAATGSPSEPKSGRRRAKLGVPRGVLFILAWASSAAVGLGAGYLVLHFLRPDTFPLP